jgi:hypothetical protein
MIRNLTHDHVDQRLDCQIVSSHTVGMKRQDLELIQQRKKQVAERLAKLDRERAELVQEMSDLAVTERTLARLLHVDLPEQEKNTPSKFAIRKKPDGIPTVYEMTVALLLEARKTGQSWVEPQEIVRGIREKWWPDVESNDVNPTLWRLYRNQKLSKKDNRYGLMPGQPRQPDQPKIMEHIP